MNMPPFADAEIVQTLEIRKDIEIAATPALTFEAVLEELGPGSELPDGKPFPMKLEAWPGGRWYRDLGEAGGHPYGHLWGHVQVIKAPVLIELTGPMMMSFAAINHLQYRLVPEENGTRLMIVHRAIGIIPPDLRAGMSLGWDHGLARVRLIAERKSAR
jgi:uncharacterized protein YndB with AHSA1/START domain